MRFIRKIIRIKATDSPNVKEGRQAIPGVITAEEYAKRRATWDPVRQSIGLDAEFWEGADNLLFPPDWLNRAEELARALKGRPRKAKAIGIDPAEGGDRTAMAAVDELGLIELVSKQTPDTSVITGEALAFMRRHGVNPDYVVFDRGGGGKEHADRLRAQGFPVRTVAFGEAVSPEPRRGTASLRERKEVIEERYTYRNRRAELYHTLRQLLDPAQEGMASPFGLLRNFALPAEYPELRRQLAPLPLLYDGEGRLYLPPKRRKAGAKESTEKTLEEILGCSPDEADATVLAVYGLTSKPTKKTIVFS